MAGDWIYNYWLTNTLARNTTRFTRYNYKTKQYSALATIEETKVPHDATVIQQDDQLHFLGGDLANGLQNPTTLKTHYIYNTNTNSWLKETDFPGAVRRHALGAYIGNKLYFGLGVDYGNRNVSLGFTTYHTDLWSYDLSARRWEKLADLPGGRGRLMCAYFTIGSDIYLTAGAEGITGNTATATPETWCYNTTTNTWSRKADYPGKGQIWLASFSIGNYGYVGLGETTTYNSSSGKNTDYHMYRYNPGNDNWIEISNFIRISQLMYSIPFAGTSGTQGIVFGGTADSRPYNNQVYMLTP